MRYNETLYTFDAGCNRKGEIEIVYKNPNWEGKCAICNATSENTPLLYTDGSGGEYYGCCLCENCIYKLFNGETAE